MKRILVSGGAGFIGTALIEKLVDDNQIISIDNYYSGYKSNHIIHPSVQYLHCDTNDILENSIVQDFDADMVYHLGEYSRIVSSFQDIRECQRFNGSGTFEILEYCRQHKAKLIYAASSSKFGNDGDDENLSPYSWWKAKNTELIRNYHNWWDLDYAIAYFYNVYGPRQIDTGHMATVIGIFQSQYSKGLPLTIVSPGTQKRDFTHIDDIIRGLMLIGEHGKGDDYLLGTGKNYTILEIARAFQTKTIIIPERTGERFTSQAFPSKMKKEFEWEAKINILEYINEWIREH